MGFFKKRSTQELQGELQRLTEKRIRLEGKAELKGKIGAEKTRIGKAVFGSGSGGKALKGAGKIVGKYLSAVGEKAEQERKKKKGKHIIIGMK